MTANLRIVPLNHHDAATLTTSIAPAADFPATNTQNSIRSQVWRTTSNAAQSLSGTLPATPVRTATFCGLFLHTAGGPGSTGTIRFQAYSDAAWTTQIYDSTALAANNITPTEVYDFGIGTNDPFAGTWPWWVRFAETTQIRSYKFSFANIPGSALQASQIVIGKHMEAAVNPDYGMTLGWMDNSDRNRSRGGSLRTSVGASWRAANLDLNGINENERAAWLDFYRMCGTGRYFVFDAFPLDGTRLERDHLFVGTLSALNAIGRQVNRLTSRLQVEEV